MEHYIQCRIQKTPINSKKKTRRQRRNDLDKFVKTIERDITGKQRDITGTQMDITGTQRNITGTQRDITGTQKDITGTQRRGFEIFKQLQLQERNKLRIDPITKTECKEYNGKLWNEQEARVKKEQKRRIEAK